VATPEENSYIESLFSLVEKEVILRYEFDSLYHARDVFQRYSTGIITKKEGMPWVGLALPNIGIQSFLVILLSHQQP